MVYWLLRGIYVYCDLLEVWLYIPCFILHWWITLCSFDVFSSSSVSLLLHLVSIYVRFSSYCDSQIELYIWMRGSSVPHLLCSYSFFFILSYPEAQRLLPSCTKLLCIRTSFSSTLWHMADNWSMITLVTTSCLNYVYLFQLELQFTADPL